YAQPYGAPSATLVASLLTGTSGAWAVSVKPSWATTYSAHWKSTVSSTVSVGVRPTISFTIGQHQRAAVKVKAATSHAGRKVYIQRFTKFHEWVKFRAGVLQRGRALVDAGVPARRVPGQSSLRGARPWAGGERRARLRLRGAEAGRAARRRLVADRAPGFRAGC